MCSIQGDTPTALGDEREPRREPRKGDPHRAPNFSVTTSRGASMKRRHGPGRPVRIVVAAFVAAALAAPAVATASPSGASAPGFSRLAGTTTVYAAHSSR